MRLWHTRTKIQKLPSHRDLLNQQIWEAALTGLHGFFSIFIWLSSLFKHNFLEWKRPWQQRCGWIGWALKYERFWLERPHWEEEI